MSDPDEPVVVFQAANDIEAHLVKNLLLDEGIEASVSEEHAQILLPSSPLLSPHVLVRRADEARARPIIESYDDEQIRRAERPDWKCPACGATVVGAFDECDVCGADRPGTEAG